MPIDNTSSFKALYYALEQSVGGGPDQAKLLSICGMSAGKPDASGNTTITIQTTDGKSSAVVAKDNETAIVGALKTKLASFSALSKS